MLSFLNRNQENFLITNSRVINIAALDHLHHHGATSHTIIYHQGRFFRLEAFHRGVLLKPADLERFVYKSK